MNTILANLVNSAKNTHVSVPLYLALACDLASIWFPQYDSQLKHTRAVLFTYCIGAAAVSGPQPKAIDESKPISTPGNTGSAT